MMQIIQKTITGDGTTPTELTLGAEDQIRDGGILKLGIQAPQDSVIIINENEDTPILVGNFGIYELNFLNIESQFGISSVKVTLPEGDYTGKRIMLDAVVDILEDEEGLE